MTRANPSPDPNALRRRLLAWYRRERRDLPWRDPEPVAATWRCPERSGHPFDPKPRAAWGTPKTPPASEARHQATVFRAPSAPSLWGFGGSDPGKGGEPLAARKRRGRSGHAGRDPYPVWVSEIMLQQTRVAAVIPYYRRFLDRFPAIAALAAAREDEVLAVWSGLGYYRRARMLHQAAKQIVRGHGGVFPLDPEAVRALPGIGDYTCGAILSISAGVPLAAVDGNAARIVSRVLGHARTPRQAKPIVEIWLSRRRPGEFNQALMDLGATVCLPRAPECGRCPLRNFCASRRLGSLPAARPRARSVAVERNLLLARRSGKVLLAQRPGGAARMPGMWELPGIEAPGNRRPERVVRHQITHHAIRASVFEARGRSGFRIKNRGERSAGSKTAWIPESKLAELALTGLARKILLGRKAPSTGDALREVE